MAFDCSEEYCESKIENGAFLVAPCNTFVYPEDGGKPDFVATFDQFDFQDPTDIDVNNGRQFNQKKTLRCRTRCSSSTDPVLTFSLCVCLTDPFHCSMLDTLSSCTFDWMWFPNPEDCENPDPATDAFYYGTSEGGFENYGGSASDAESLTLSVATASCGRKIDRCNFCDQDVVAPLVAKQTSELVANKKAA